MDFEKERIMGVFGLSLGDKISEVGLESLKTYQRYLETRLSFPFMAEFDREIGPRKSVRIRVHGLEDMENVWEGKRQCVPPWQKSVFLTDREQTSSWWRTTAHGSPSIGRNNMTEGSGESLRAIVGERVYLVWVDMLHCLVPDGRTHRLAPMIAAMLQYASRINLEKCGKKAERGTVANALYCSEGASYEEGRDILLPVVERLLKDSRVRYKRTNSRGEDYSIAEEAIGEYLNWYNMPWEEYY